MLFIKKQQIYYYLRLKGLILINLLLVTPLLTHAINLDSAYIENFTKTYLENKLPVPPEGKITITVKPIDSRIKIKNCTKELNANIPEKIYGRNVNVKISCDDSTPWQLYLPVKVIVTLPMLVAKSTIEKGNFISNNNIELAYIDKTKIKTEPLTDKNLIIGGKAKRRIAKGSPIRFRNVCLICKGDRVTIIAKSTDFTIKTQGKAITSGNIKDQIQVKNSRSGKVITAEVESLKRVIIIL